MADKLKSAIELAMEKYGIKKDSDDSLTDSQKEEINDIRSMYKAKRAEREILYNDELKKLRTKFPAQYAELSEKAEQEYRFDRKRLEEEEKRKISAVRTKK